MKQGFLSLSFLSSLPPSLSLSFPSLHLSFLPSPESKTVRNPRRKSQNARAGEEAKGLIISCSTTVVLRGKLRQSGAGTCSGSQSNLELLTPRLLTTLLWPVCCTSGLRPRQGLAPSWLLPASLTWWWMGLQGPLIKNSRRLWFPRSYLTRILSEVAPPTFPGSSGPLSSSFSRAPISCHQAFAQAVTST